jgi:serine phosphatase RsbU (regulator of sigma subunit)
MTWVDFANGLDDEQAIHRLVCGIRGIAPGPGPGHAIFEGECPYRGLDAFKEEHARFFFGRATQVDWLLRHRVGPMAQSSHARRFLAILGPSGSGKSSLALAGLIPALRAGKVAGSAAWPIIIFRPGYNPLENLAIELSRLGGSVPTPVAIQNLIAGLIQDRSTLHLTARLALHEVAASRLVVLVDQFEEIFSLCTDEALRRALIENLLYAASIVAGPTVVFLTMRVDFLGKCVSSPELAAALSDGQELVGPMKKDELRMAIEQPASLVGCALEPGLTDLLLQDVQGQAGTLPLMQYTLLELWRARRGRRLTIAAYREVGGVEGALEHRADEIFAGFRSRPQELDICRRIFLRLTQPGEGTEDTKRRARFDELIPSQAEHATVEEVVRKLVDARLITTGGRETAAPRRDESDPPPYIEIAHEALIRGCGQLRQWIDADRAGLRTHRQLTEAVRDWDQHRRDASYLYVGSRLDVAREWADTHKADISPLELEFLEASLLLRRQRDAQEYHAESQRRELQLAETLRRRLLPNSVPQVAGFEFFACYQPVREVGGDLYDFVLLPNEHVAVVLGDISGKGFSAALMMAKLTGDIRYCLLTENGPASAANKLNSLLFTAGVDERFISLMLIILDPLNRRLTLCSAGHPPALVCRAQGRVEEVGEDAAGLPMGIIPDLKYQQSEFQLEPSDVVVIYSDGVADCRNAREEIYGWDIQRRLKQLAESIGTPEAIGRSILQDIGEFSAGHVQPDDITVICFGPVAP